MYSICLSNIEVPTLVDEAMCLLNNDLIIIILYCLTPARASTPVGGGGGGTNTPPGCGYHSLMHFSAVKLSTLLLLFYFYKFPVQIIILYLIINTLIIYFEA